MQERYKSIAHVLSVLNENFKPQQNESIPSLKYCKPSSDDNENGKEWMGHLKIKANDCSYKKHDRWLKEQLINGINNNYRNNYASSNILLP